MKVALVGIGLAIAAIPALAGGDATRGRALYESRCVGCHSVDADRVGPAHRGVFGRRAGARPGYAYTPALTASGIVWNEATLDVWLADPQQLVPGQAMNVKVSDAQARQDLIGYLRTLAE